LDPDLVDHEEVIDKVGQVTICQLGPVTAGHVGPINIAIPEERHMNVARFFSDMRTRWYGGMIEKEKGDCADREASKMDAG
jgi:hypothetical protein